MLRTPEIDLQALIREEGEPCVSMYLPTGSAERDPDQGRIRLKNMVRQAHDELKNLGVRETEPVMKNLDEVLRLEKDQDYFGETGRGLAVFVSNNLMKRYPLPRECDELLVASYRFHVKPLIPLLTTDMETLVLKVARKAPRLYHLSRIGVREIEVENMPDSMTEALHEEDLAGHHVYSAGTGGGESSGPIHHGHSTEKEAEKEKFGRYARILDKAVRDKFSDGKLPLLLLGVEYERHIFQENSSYPNILEEGINGNAENMTEDEIYNRAAETLEPRIEKELETALERFGDAKGSKKASTDASEIIAGAVNGRVDTLFVGRGVRCWGIYDGNSNKVHWHEGKEVGDIDLLDFAAVEAHANGALVYLCEADRVPSESSECPLAAILRF